LFYVNQKQYFSQSICRTGEANPRPKFGPTVKKHLSSDGFSRPRNQFGLATPDVEPTNRKDLFFKLRENFKNKKFKKISGFMHVEFLLQPLIKIGQFHHRLI
jgi:hypothetical protein